MNDHFERDAYAPGEYERLQDEFDAEARKVVEALIEENTDLDGNVDHDGILIVLAVKYLNLRYELKRRTVVPSETGALAPASAYVLAIQQSVGSILSQYSANKILDRAKEIANGH